jgi:hypothetical protein
MRITELQFHGTTISSSFKVSQSYLSAGERVTSPSSPNSGAEKENIYFGGRHFPNFGSGKIGKRFRRWRERCASKRKKFKNSEAPIYFSAALGENAPV